MNSITILALKRLTYNCQIGVEWILVFRAHNLIQVICGRITWRNVFISLEDRNVRKARASQMKSAGEPEGSAADNDDRVRLGDTHLR